MSSFITAGANKFRRAREWATPTLKESAFLQKGVLTPEEFVKAGDELVYKCPTWSWESGDEKKRKNFLPDDKQYLVTRNVPCPTRVSTLENSVAVGDEDTHIDEECGGDDWLVSRMISPEEQQRCMDEKLEEEFDILDYEEDGKEKNKANANDGDHDNDNDNDNEAVESSLKNMNINSDEKQTQEKEDDEYADMEEFEDDNVMEDEAAVSAGATANSNGGSGSSNNAAMGGAYKNNIMRVRTYDLSITYDKYYQTPRVWMMGYESADSSQPLTGDQMLEDVMSDYANRTVTIDPHPHVTGYHASIHPCQHGKVMKTIVRNLTKAVGDNDGDDGDLDTRAPSVDMYLFIFLKFVASIIPTINYDFTMEVTASTKK